MSELKIAAAYIRVSTDDQEEYSPDSQLKICQKYAKEHGYILPTEFIFQDDAISGSSARRRNDFNRMIAMAKEKDRPFDTILVWKFSRFARNREESVFYKGLLRRRGITVISVSEPIVDGPFGTLIESIIEWFDEYYLINLSSEVKRGMLEKFSRGEAMGTAAFGYKIDSENKTYIIDEPAAEIIRGIFESYANGEKCRALATRLALSGVKTRRGNPPDNRWVEYILRNPVYIGKIRWSKEGHAASARHYDDPNILIVDGKHPPIINIETWDAVQKRLDAQKAAYRKWQRTEQPIEWMLKGLVRCGSCGATLVHLANRASMQCHNYASGRGCYTSHSLAFSRANKAVVDGLRQAAALKEFNLTPVTHKKNSAPKVDYAKLIDAERKKLIRCRDAYQAGADTLDEYIENKKRINRMIHQLEEKASAEQSPTEINVDEYAERVLAVAEFIERDDVSELAKNEMLRTVVSYIVFNRAENCLDIYFYA